MSTTKRERQRENRRRRLVEHEAASKRYATRRRVKLIGSAAVAVAAAIAVVALIQRGNDSEVVTTGADESADIASDAEDEPIAEPDLELPDDPAADEPNSNVAETASGCPEPDGSSGRVIDFDGPQPLCIDPAPGYVAVFDTSEGEMRFELTAGDTPNTVNNFVTLARWGYYDETLLFRTDPSIDIIQGGSPHTNDNWDPGPGYTIPDEPAFDTDPDTGQPVGPYRYGPGQLVMARSGGFDSAGAQFFITTGTNTDELDSQGTYVVFGNTDKAGLVVAQAIIGLHEPGGSLGGAPSRDVTVRSVTIEETPADG